MSGASPNRLLRLQQEINRDFVRRRDAGLDTTVVYARLIEVEEQLNSRGIWAAMPPSGVFTSSRGGRN